jgi:hypothetical protein
MECSFKAIMLVRLYNLAALAKIIFKICKRDNFARVLKAGKLFDFHKIYVLLADFIFSFPFK